MNDSDSIARKLKCFYTKHSNQPLLIKAICDGEMRSTNVAMRDGAIVVLVALLTGRECSPVGRSKV
jgi:hypothetical protein